MAQFRIERNGEELDINFSIKFDRISQDYYINKVFHDEVEIELTEDEWAKLNDHFECNKDYYLYHNDESNI